MKTIILFFTVFIYVCLTSSALALNVDSISPGWANITSRIGKLANGFSYYVDSISTNDDRIDLNFLVNAGSEHQNEEQGQLAHFIEHLLANGTRSHPDLKRFLLSRGIKGGRHSNAWTMNNMTRYWLSMPNNRQTFREILAIVKEWADGSLDLSSGQIEAQRGAVFQESGRVYSIDKIDKRIISDQIVMGKVIQPVNYIGHFSETHWSNLKNFTREDVVSFYKKWYVPQHQAIIVLGDVNVDEIVSEIRKTFTTIKSVETKRNDTIANATFNTGNQFILYYDSIRSYTSEIIFKFPFNRISSVSDLHRVLVDRLIAEMVNERFNKVSSGVYNVLYYQQRYPNIAKPFSCLSIVSKHRPESRTDSYTTAMRELYRVEQNGFLPEELRQSANAFWKNYKKPMGLVDRMAQAYADWFIYGDASIYTSEMWKIVKTTLERITLEDVHQRFRNIFQNSTRDFVLFLPRPEKLDTINNDTIEAWTKQAKIDYVKDSASGNSRFAFQVPEIKGLGKFAFSNSYSRGNIKPILNHSLNVIELVLPNKVRVLLKPIKGAEKVIVKAVRPVPVKFMFQNDSLAAFKSCSLVLSSGLGPLNSTEWSRFKNEKDIRFGGLVKEDHVSIFSEFSPDNLEDALHAMYLAFTSPKIDTIIVEQFKKSEAKLLLDYQREDSQEDAYTRLLLKYSGEESPNSIDLKEIKKIASNKLIDLYKQLYRNDGNLTFVICGNFALDSVSVLVQNYLEHIPVQQNYVPLLADKNKQLNTDCSLVKKTIVQPDIVKAKVNIGFPATISINDRFNLQLKIMESVFREMIFERLRNKERLSYGPNSFSMVRKTCSDNNILFGANFDCPDNQIEEAIRFTLDEFNKLKTKPEQEHLSNVKTLWLSNRKIQLKNPAYHVDRISACVVSGVEDLSSIDEEKIVKYINLEDIKRLARKFTTNDYRLFKLSSK